MRSFRAIRFVTAATFVMALFGCVGHEASVAPSKSATRGGACDWRTVATADPNWGQSQLVAVAAPSDSSAWAVGNTFTGQEAGRSAPVVERWTDHRWTLVHRAVPADVFLTDVGADTPDDVWAVGADRDGGAFATRWDGRRWLRASLPRLRGSNTLYGVDVVRRDDVWAVGAEARAGRGFTLVLHWDGTRWTHVRSPSPAPRPLTARSYAGLQSVDARSSRDVWAVGESVNVAPEGQSTTLILHWDGNRWSRIPSPSARNRLGAAYDMLFAVAAISSSEAWAVGTWNSARPGYGGGGDHTLVEHWDGRHWRIVPTPTDAHRTILYGVLEARAAVVAVGDQAESYRTLIATRARDRWRLLPAQPGSLADIAAAPSGRLWAVGQRADHTFALTCGP
jgi:hypothetical protein